MNNSSPTRIAVIGGGITGLAAAHRLTELAQQQNRSLDITLFEASDRLGGVFETRHIDGYTIETGADAFITNNPWAVELCERLGLGGQLIGTNEKYRRSFILLDGKPTPTPNGFELLVPRSLKSLLAAPFLSYGAKERVAAEVYVEPRADRSDESLADFVIRRFGHEALNRIIQPLVGGIYTSDPRHLSMQATLPRFVEMERRHGSLLRAVWTGRQIADDEETDEDASGARYGLFTTLAGGMSTLVNALEERLQSVVTIQQTSPVTSIDATPDGRFELVTSGDSRQTFDKLILAIPSYRAADLVASWDEGLAEKLRAIEYASSAVVVTGHRLEDVGHPLDAFGMVVPHREGRKILAVSFISRKYPNRAPDGCVQLRTFVGGAMQPELLEQDDDSVVAMVLEELSQLLGVNGAPEVAVLIRYDRAMPQYHVGHLNRVAEIERAAATHENFALAGNAYRGVGIPDCIHGGEQAAERVFGAA